MSLIKGATFVFVIVLFNALGHAEAFRSRKSQPPFTPPKEYANGCAPPREGDWLLQNSFRLDGPGSDYGPVALSEMTVVRQGDSYVYNATGLVDTTNGQFIDVPVTFVALYNPVTCYFTGTAFAPSTNTTDSFTYWSTGTTLYGPYVVAQNAALLSPLLGITNATFVR